MSMSDFHSWWSVALLAVFIAIVAWAWSGKRREEFEQAARMPLDDDEPVTPRRASNAPRGDREDSRNG